MSGLPARDVEHLADWLGSLPESHNTTWIAVAVDSLAYRIVESDWLAAIRDDAKAEALREAAEAMPFGYSHAAALLRERAALLDGGDR